MVALRGGVAHRGRPRRAELLIPRGRTPPVRTQSAQYSVQTLTYTRERVPDASQNLHNWREHAHHTRGALSLLTATSGGNMSAEGRVQPKTEISLAAGIVGRVEGHREQGPAHVEAAHAQQAQAGSDARAPRGAPVKKETTPHRRCASS